MNSALLSTFCAQLQQAGIHLKGPEGGASSSASAVSCLESILEDAEEDEEEVVAKGPQKPLTIQSVMKLVLDVSHALPFCPAAISVVFFSSFFGNFSVLGKMYAVLFSLRM